MKYTCPCCGYQTHDREDSLWEICEVCYWQNEPISLTEPYFVGGPNSVSLVQAQQNFILFGANDEVAKQHVRKPKTDEPKDITWQPFGFDKNLGGQTNKNLTQNINLSNAWKQDWHTIVTEQYGVESQQKGIWLLAKNERFEIELTYKREPNDCVLRIKESEITILDHQSVDLETTKILLNEWIERIDKKIETILDNVNDEIKTFEINIKINKQLQKSTLKCWINRDWGHAQIRNVTFQIDDEIIKVNQTFTDFERMLFHLQRNELSEERLIQTCFFCRYSCYNVAGNDDFGDLNCFRHCKEEIIKPKEKHELIELFVTKKDIIMKVQEIHYCDDYQDVIAGDWLYKLTVR